MTLISLDADRLVVRVTSPAETAEFARRLAPLIRPGTVIGLIGPLGAGKTTLVRSLAEALGADPEAVNSPTYVLIQEYEACLPITHFDAYRLESPEAFDDLGADEYLFGPGVCLVEWADLVPGRLPPGAWTIRLHEDSGARIIEAIMDRESLARLAHALTDRDATV